MSDCVLFEKLPAKDGGYVELATLNAPATLNSLTLEMIDVLTPRLEAWREDDDLKCVVIRGSGERAFCAGGDIQALQDAINENHLAGKIVNDYADNFFEREYRLTITCTVFPSPS